MNGKPSNGGRKPYPLHQSPLYRLNGRGQFESIVGVKWNDAETLFGVQNYRVWPNQKGREIQRPIGELADVHRRIARLFKRIELPDYVYSKKGRSYVDNARQHVGNSALAKTDISGFYPSVTHKMVYRVFRYNFHCAPDVARRLADICCYRQEHVPTGSKVSGYLAFFAARQMFDDIFALVMKSGCRMTLYVDDITVTGPHANLRLLAEIRKIIRHYGLTSKHTKSRTYAPSAVKTVTGVIVAEKGLRLPNVRHLKIRNIRREIVKAPPAEKDRLRRSLRGRLQEAKQVLGD